MERDAEEPDPNEASVAWSGSDGSQERWVSESAAGSCYDDDTSDAEYRSDPRPARLEAGAKSPELYQNQEWKSAGDPQRPPGLDGSEEEASYQGEDEEDFSLSGSRESLPESPHLQTSPHGSRSQRRDAGETAERRSPALSLDRTADVTLALTPTRGQPQKASSRRCPGTLSAGVDSSEEGGRHEAPPASVFFGMSDEGAEPAETWNSESDTDPCRPDRQRLRSTRVSHNQSQSERQAKENKSKCKKIALLLTDAPNPQNKGALLFNKRRQRVEKYTLVSYGTGDDEHGSRDQIGEESEEIRSAGYNFVETSDSELEERYCLRRQQQNFGPNRGSRRDMEALPDTKGKGVLMFAKCRQRVDEVVSEHEQLRSKGTAEEKLFGPAHAEAHDIYDAQMLYYPDDNVDGNIGQQVEYQEYYQEINHPSPKMSRALVSNRTAKPFLGFHARGPAPFTSAGAVPTTKKHELKFKVPVLTNTNPQVWSPTGDIIASRDERISVPAIKTAMLPESKRRVGGRQPSTVGQDKQNQGERRSYLDAEEDCFSLGAEACNFMQPRRVKLKNPPPVAPKPVINPACPPTMRRSPLSEPYISPRSPASPPYQTSVRSHSPQHLHQRDWDPSPPGRGGPGRAPAMPGARPLLQPSRKVTGQQPPQSSVSMPVCGPTRSPPPSSKSRSDVSSHPKPSPPSQASPRGGVSDGGFKQTGNGPVMEGKGALAKRQSWSEKFPVDAERVQENKPRSPSPTSSLPKSWRYSSNVRAPPPVAYNPLLAPFYPPSAARQAPSTSPKVKPKSKDKAPKQLNPLDIMKHQPYQLSRSLFKYEAAPEVKAPKHAPVSKFETTKKYRNRLGYSHSSRDEPVEDKAEAPAAPEVPVGPRNVPAHQTARSAAARPVQSSQASKASQQSPAGDSIASAFSPASLIARGARQMAPRPKFCAKKPVVTGPQWRPVALLR